MKRLLPRSLVGQIAVVMALTLLVAQLINFTLILNERQRLSFAQNEGPAITRFVNMASEVSGMAPEERRRALSERRRGPRFFIGERNYLPVRREAQDRRVEELVREAAAAASVPLRDVHAVVTDLPARPAAEAPRPSRDAQRLYVSARLEDGSWLHGRMITPRRDPWLAGRLAVATLLLYILVLGTMILLAMRLAWPLRDLTAAAEASTGRTEAPFVEPRGPSDLKRAIEAFNGMNGRLSALLHEKDRMLGALSHDLRTPLASLRIRAEGMEPAEERERMVGTIAEMTEMLEDTLLLVRTGRVRERARAVDIGALADTIVEELRELGHDVVLETHERQVACVKPSLLRRAIRNLVENALKYGGSAQVAVVDAGTAVRIEVADRGPGIPEAQIAKVQEPFYRMEESRNRDTGGTGLGLTIAKTIAQSHDGELTLQNREGGGLLATLKIPRAGSDF